MPVTRARSSHRLGLCRPCGGDAGETVATAAILAAFMASLKKELGDALPDMVGRALGVALKPIQKRQQELSEATAQIHLKFSDAQTQQALSIEKQIAAYTTAGQSMTVGGHDSAAGRPTGSLGQLAAPVPLASSQLPAGSFPSPQGAATSQPALSC